MLLPILLKVKLVELVASGIQLKLSLETYNFENHCDYHGAMVGHSTYMWELLKQKVQGLIKGGWLEPEVNMSTLIRELDIQTVLTRKSRSRIAPWKLKIIHPSSWTVEPRFSRAHPTWGSAKLATCCGRSPQNQTSSHYLYAFVILAFPVSFMSLCLSMRQFKFSL